MTWFIVVVGSCLDFNSNSAYIVTKMSGVESLYVELVRLVMFPPLVVISVKSGFFVPSIVFHVIGNRQLYRSAYRNEV